MRWIIFAFLLLSGVAILLAPSFSEAAPSPIELSSFLDENLARVSDLACTGDEDGGGTGEDWEMTKFFLNISPYVTVGIRDVAEVTFAPEIEFIWERSEASDAAVAPTLR